MSPAAARSCAWTRKGFVDGENDGPFVEEPNQNPDEADVVWKLDMMNELGVSQHNMCSCSVTAVGDLLFVNTSNGVDEQSHDDSTVRRTKFHLRAEDDWQGAVDRQFARSQHPARPVVLARVRGVGWRAAGDLRRRRRLAVQLCRRGRERQVQAAVEVRLQSQGFEVRVGRSGDAQSHHRHTGDLRRSGLRRRR